MSDISLTEDEVQELEKLLAKRFAHLSTTEDSFIYSALPKLLAERSERQWQPIETAKKDGTTVELLYLSQSGYEYSETAFGSWEFIEPSEWDSSPVFGWKTPGSIDDEPTHWRPLSIPPEPTERV